MNYWKIVTPETFQDIMDTCKQHGDSSMIYHQQGVVYNLDHTACINVRCGLYKMIFMPLHLTINDTLINKTLKKILPIVIDLLYDVYIVLFRYCHYDNHHQPTRNIKLRYSNDATKYFTPDIIKQFSYNTIYKILNTYMFVANGLKLDMENVNKKSIRNR